MKSCTRAEMRKRPLRHVNEYSNRSKVGDLRSNDRDSKGSLVQAAHECQGWPVIQVGATTAIANWSMDIRTLGAAVGTVSCQDSNRNKGAAEENIEENAQECEE